MDPVILTFAMVGGLFLLLALGMPIAFALMAIGVASLVASQGWASADYLIGSFPYTSSSDFAFVIIPLFLFMGEMAYVAGLSERAFRLARAWVGHLPGGLPIAAVASCAAFASVCGSSIVTATTIGRISIPEMLKAGHSQRLAGGAVAMAGTLGVLIPPSSILVIYSIVTQVSVIDLFACAIVPGIITALMYSLGIVGWVKIDPREGLRTRQTRQAWAPRLRALASGWEIVVLFGVVMGSMLTGIATPTEASAFGAVTAAALAIIRRIPPSKFREGLITTGTSTCAVFMLIVGSGIFSLAFATTQVPQQLAAFVSGLDVSPALLTALLLIPYFFLGMFLDAISMILLTMPVVFPIVVQNDINPVLFGILVTKMTEIGNVTPPVGLNVFVLKAAYKDIDLGQVFRGVVPFIGVELVLLALFIGFPELVLFPLANR